MLACRWESYKTSEKVLEEDKPVRSRGGYAMVPPGPWDKELWGQRVEKTLSPSMENQSGQDSKRGSI